MNNIKTLQGFIAVTLFLLCIGFSLPSYAESINEPEKYTQIRLIADKTIVKGGDTVRIGIEQTIHPKWHIYWLNPGDSGTPTTINWNLPPGFTASDLKWPTPIKISTGPLVNYGHENKATLLQTLTIPDYIQNEKFILDAKVNLLVCHDICIPESHDVEIIFNGKVNDDVFTIEEAEKKLPLTLDWETKFYKKDGNTIFHVTTEDIQNISKASNLILFPEDWGVVDNNADATLRILNNGFTITQKRGERDLNKTPTLPIVLSYFDRTDQKRSIRLIASLDSEHETATATTVEIPTAQQNKNSSTPIGLIHALILALLGGLILNLMPCVFPVLSMKALSLVNLKKKEETKARGYGLSYTAGVLVSFGLIAGILLALKSGGAQIGWGFQLQSPVIIALLTYLIFVLGLNLSGFFEFSGKFSNFGQKLTQQSGNRGAFFTGVLATLVATPCTAPFMGAAMGFALTQPAIISMLVFLTLGFGLAIPYLALCFIPALRSKLPKPGQWMETFRQFLAFPMFITAAWLVWVLSQQIDSIGVFCILLSLISIVFIVWLVRNLPKKEKPITRIICELLIVISVIFIANSTYSLATSNKAVGSNYTNSENQNWEEFTPQKLDSLLSTTSDPVFVNMTAAWCITCKVNEKVALSIESTKKIFSDKKVQYLKGDWTNQNPDITAYLNSFDRQGVPIYVYYGPKNNQSNLRPEPIVLPQILTPGLVEKTILDNS